MAMYGLNNLDFGPAFGGFSAAEANNEQQNALRMKTLQDMFQANQMAAMTQKTDLESDRFRQETPFSVMESSLKGNRAAMMDTPTMLEEYRLGEVGKSQKSAAEGSKAKRTLESDVLATNTKNKSEVDYTNELATLGKASQLAIIANAGGAGAGMSSFNAAVAAMNPAEYQKGTMLGDLLDIIRRDPASAPKHINSLREASVLARAKGAEERDKEGFEQIGRMSIAQMQENRADRRQAISDGKMTNNALAAEQRAYLSAANSAFGEMRKAETDAEEMGSDFRLRSSIVDGLKQKNKGRKPTEAEIDAAIEEKKKAFVKKYVDRYNFLVKEAEDLSKLMRMSPQERAAHAKKDLPTGGSGDIDYSKRDPNRPTAVGQPTVANQVGVPSNVQNIPVN